MRPVTTIWNMETKTDWPRGVSPSEAPLWVVNERTLAEEVQRGLWTSLQRRPLSRSISECHARWIEGLEIVADGGHS